MAVVGYIVILGGLAALCVLGLRWTRLRRGDRRQTQFDYPDVGGVRGARKRIDIPGEFPGDPIE